MVTHYAIVFLFLFLFVLFFSPIVIFSQRLFGMLIWHFRILKYDYVPFPSSKKVTITSFQVKPRIFFPVYCHLWRAEHAFSIFVNLLSLIDQFHSEDNRESIFFHRNFLFINGREVILIFHPPISFMFHLGSYEQFPIFTGSVFP